jgi:quercetin dioxygenase-like cupin family protein
MAVVTKAQRKQIAAPDETRSFPKGRIDVVTVGDTTLGRVTFEPGWHWAEHVKPVAGTRSCLVPHLQYVLSGRLHVRFDNGEEDEATAGDVVWVPPGHDGWVVGTEPFVAIEVMGAGDYAKPR